MPPGPTRDPVRKEGTFEKLGSLAGSPEWPNHLVPRATLWLAYFARGPWQTKSNWRNPRVSLGVCRVDRFIVDSRGSISELCVEDANSVPSFDVLRTKSV